MVAGSAHLPSQPQAAPFVGAVVVTSNRKEQLEQCIEALLAQTCPLRMICVIDNRSTDGTPDLLTSRYSKLVAYHRLPENRGSAGGLSCGLALAQRDGWDWIWLMDDDGVPEPHALEALLAVGSTDPELFAVTARKVAPDGRTLCRDWIWDPGRRRTKAPSMQQWKQPSFDIDYAGTCGLLLRRNVIEKAGLPMAKLFFGFEDYEYSYRIRQHGRMMLVPGAVIQHPAGNTDNFSSYWKLYYQHRNLIYFRLYLRGRVYPHTKLSGLIAAIVREAITVLAARDRKIWRLRVLTTALIHGCLARLGPGPSWLHA